MDESESEEKWEGGGEDEEGGWRGRLLCSLPCRVGLTAPRLSRVLVRSNKSRANNPEIVTARRPVHRTKTPCWQPHTWHAFRDAFHTGGARFNVKGLWSCVRQTESWWGQFQLNTTGSHLHWKAITSTGGVSQEDRTRVNCFLFLYIRPGYCVFFLDHYYNLP